MNPQSNNRWIWFSVAAVVILAALFWRSSSTHGPADSGDARPVESQYTVAGEGSDGNSIAAENTANSSTSENAPTASAKSAGLYISHAEAELGPDALYSRVAAIDGAETGAIPDGQRDAVASGVALLVTGNANQAVEVFEEAIQKSPFSSMAGMGLYYQAKACSELGCLDVAQEAIASLKSHFPDSHWTTRAEMLASTLAGRDQILANERLQREDEALELYREYKQRFGVKVNTIGEHHRDLQALKFLGHLVADYPDTRMALMAMRSEAYILSRDLDRTDETMRAFQTLLEHLKVEAPHCESVYMLMKSIGALYQRKDMPEQALEQFEALAAYARDPAVATDAALQAVGAHNETLQKRIMIGGSVSADEWEALRDRCRSFKKLTQATMRERSRADVIIAESLHWQLMPREALAAAEHHLATYDESIDPAGVATAHLIAGECLQRFGRHQEALEHYRWIANRYKDREPWPRPEGYRVDRPVFPTDRARTHYRIYDALRRGGAPREEVEIAADVVLTEFPNTRYAELVEQQEIADGYALMSGPPG